MEYEPNCGQNSIVYISRIHASRAPKPLGNKGRRTSCFCLKNSRYYLFAHFFTYLPESQNGAQINYSTILVRFSFAAKFYAPF